MTIVFASRSIVGNPRLTGAPPRSGFGRRRLGL